MQHFYPHIHTMNPAPFASLIAIRNDGYIIFLGKIVLTKGNCKQTENLLMN